MSTGPSLHRRRHLDDLRPLDAGDPRQLAEPHLHRVAVGDMLGVQDLELHRRGADPDPHMLEDFRHARREAVAEEQDGKLDIALLTAQAQQQEVARAVREAWPQEKPLFVRVSSIDDVEGGWSLDDTLAFARELKRVGVDVVDCSSGGILGSATAATKTMLPRVPGFQLPFSERIKKAAGLKTMAVGLILTAPVRDVRVLDVDVLSVPLDGVTPELVEIAHRASKQVHVWTVNRPKDMRRMITLGVDNIITDKPQVLRQLLSSPLSPSLE